MNQASLQTAKEDAAEVMSVRGADPSTTPLAEYKEQLETVMRQQAEATKALRQAVMVLERSANRTDIYYRHIISEKKETQTSPFGWWELLLIVLASSGCTGLLVEFLLR